MSDPTLTIREQIHARIVTILETALPPLFSGIRVERNRTRPVQYYPSVVVIDGEEELLEQQSTGLTLIALSVSIEFYVQTATDEELGPAANELDGQIQLAMFADRYLDGLADDTTLGALNPAVSHEENQKPVAGWARTYSVLYCTAEGNPYSQGSP